MSRRLAVAPLALAMTLAGCATFSPDGGTGDVRRLARERSGTVAAVLDPARDADAVRLAVLQRLAGPLTADGAVEIALLNNPGLQVRLAQLGLAEADLVAAGRLRNPVFAYSNKRTAEAVQIERSLLVNVGALVLMPLALDIERRRFEQAKLVAAAEVVGLVATVRQAYFRAVAARETVAYHEQVMLAAEASSELARRMAEVGNFSKLAQMREHAFYADATAQLARARHAALAEGEQLTRLLGLHGAEAAVRLPGRLPDLPRTPMQPGSFEQAAMDRRLDVQVARLDAEAFAKSLGLTRATRLVNVLEVGYVNESETGHERANGYEIELALPLFDFGETRVARAEAHYRQALARTAEIAVQARSEVRELYSAYRTTWDLARHYRDEIVPLRKRIAEENLLRYNGMLIGVFELLADARDQVSSVNAAIEATRDFWIAETALQLALTGRSPGVFPAPGPRNLPAAAAGGH